MQPLISSAIESVQRITAELRPVMLDELGLGSVIQWYLEEFQDRTSIKYEIEMELDEVSLGSGQATAIFRILQEALTNVIRHAGASQVNLYINNEGDYFILRLNDNGRGINQSEINRVDAFGLIGMRERALAFGGTINFEGSPDSGTIVSLRLPLN
jgi:two-component system sensor histidine kinase UhpB